MKRILYFLPSVLVLLFLLSGMSHSAFAASSLPGCADGTDTCKYVATGIGRFPTDFAGMVSMFFRILLSIAGGVAVILIIVAGYNIMLSQGNAEKVKAAQETITAAIVGLLFMIFSGVILQIIGVQILNIPQFK